MLLDGVTLQVRRVFFEDAPRFASAGGMAQFQRSAINALTYQIISAAIEVHRHLGPGLLESAYQVCMEFELAQLQLSFAANKPLPLIYKGLRLDCGYRIDLHVEDQVVVELKCAEKLAPVHVAQLLTYLKLTGAPVGLLVNCNVPVLRSGVRRLLNSSHELLGPS